MGAESARILPGRVAGGGSNNLIAVMPLVRATRHRRRLPRRHGRQRHALAERMLADPVRLARNALQHTQRHLLDDVALTDADRKVADRLRGQMTEQAVQHLLAGRRSLAAVDRGDVGVFAIAISRRKQFGNDGEPSERTGRQRETA